MRELESEAEFENQKRKMVLHLLITPELENDPVHQTLIKRMISFNKLYQRHVSQVKELEGMGIYEAHLTADEKHKRHVIERKRVVTESLYKLLIGLAMTGNRELQQGHLKRIKAWYDSKIVACDDGVNSRPDEDEDARKE